MTRAAIYLASLLAAVTAHAEPTTPAHKKPIHHVPVVAAHHGVARKPVHPKAPIVAAKPKPAEPVAKPAAPAAPPGPPRPKIPRYACLRSDEVNMRAGPGERYPILWQYRRRELPVKIERDFDVWRLIEDMDGIKGWVNQALLTGKRTFVVTGSEPATMRSGPDDAKAATAILKPGVVGRILGCDASAWCHVQVGDYSGYLARASFWGTDPGETVTP